MNLVSVIALILSLAGDSATIDKGLADGLQPGDQGAIFYTLKVGQQTQRIEVGIAEISAVGDFHARITFLEKSATIRKYSVEFRVPAERTTPDSLLRLARLRLSEQKPEITLKYLERLELRQPLDWSVARAALDLHSEAERRIAEIRGVSRPKPPEPANDHQGKNQPAPAIERCPEPAADSKQEIENEQKHQGMVHLDAGPFKIGLDTEARYYNQRPRFEIRLEGFWIDRQPAGKFNVNYDEAQAYCASLGKRLPTELEWEAAAAANAIEGGPTAEEWTSSWYRPYPGNEVREPEYGEKFRIVRGFPAIQRRRFMSPDRRAADITFRCACE